MKELLVHRGTVFRNCVKCCMVKEYVNDMDSYGCVEICNCVEARAMRLYRKELYRRNVGKSKICSCVKTRVVT